jgi:hypothetical protein
MLTKDGILGAQDFTIEQVAVPEWNGSVFVRGLTAEERDEFEGGSVSFAGEGKPTPVLTNMRARLAVRCICDAEGNRLFSDDDVGALGRKCGAALDRITEVARRLSGLTKKDMEELAGNSAGAPIASSPTN